MVDRLLDAFSGCDEILLSVRDAKQAEELLPVRDEKQANSTLTIRQVTDPVCGAGPLAGIVASLRACREEWLFVTAVDMPYMDKESADDLFAYTETGSEYTVIVPVNPDGHVQPMSAFYNKRALPVLEECLQSKMYSLWRCFQKLRAARIPVERIPDSGRKLANLNRPEDITHVSGQ